MLKRTFIILTVLSTCLLFIFAGSVFALDFEKLPSGIDVAATIPDNYEVIQTGETDGGVVYVVSATQTNNADGATLSPYLGTIKIMGYSKTEGTIVYSNTYTQAGSYPKVSSKSKDYFYYVKAQSGKHQIVKVDLSTGNLASSPANGTLSGSIETTGELSTDDSQRIKVKFIAVNENDEVYVLGRRTDIALNKILKFNGTQWSNFPATDYPSAPGSTGISNAFAATVDGSGTKICYSAFGSTLYKTTATGHAIVSTGAPSGTYYGVAVIGGVDAGDAIFAFYSTTAGYVYYYDYSANTFVKSVEGGAFTNKYFNLVFIGNESKASFSYWNGTYASYSIDSSGKGLPVQMPQNATQVIAQNISGSTGTVQPISTDMSHTASGQVITDGNFISLANLMAMGHVTRTYGSVYVGYWSSTYNAYTYTHEGTSYYSVYNHNNGYYYVFTNLSSSYNTGDNFNNCEKYIYGNLIPYHYVTKQTVNLNMTDQSMTYTTIGAYGVRTMNSWIITKATANYSSFKPFKTLSQTIANYGNATYNITTNDNDTTNVTNNSSTGVETTAASQYLLTVIKSQQFKEAIYDKLLDAEATVSGITVKPVAVTSGTTTLYYTLLSGTLSDTDITADNPTKGIVVNGKLVVFKVIAPPTNTQTATLQFQ